MADCFAGLYVGRLCISQTELQRDTLPSAPALIFWPIQGAVVHYCEPVLLQHAYRAQVVSLRSLQCCQLVYITIGQRMLWQNMATYALNSIYSVLLPGPYVDSQTNSLGNDPLAVMCGTEHICNLHVR
jgi:hypothetical protein